MSSRPSVTKLPGTAPSGPAGLGSAGVPPSGNAIPVSELARRVRQTIEQAHPLQWVAGEISGFTRATSGHWYFNLKDASAQVRCAMFRGRNQWMDWQPRNGDAVEARGLPTLYEARGEFQLVVEQLRPAGQGALYEAFARLKARLEEEGLFDPAGKRALPPFPRAIGVLTSPAAAAWRDVVTTLRRRAPQVPVILYPAPVQGADAAPRLLQALQTANRRAEVDVLIVCRGGGSIEDLWAFNDEALARAIATSTIPVVSGVGHETDFTICDFAADLRAPTPTAAAELCAPPRARLLEALAALQQRMVRSGWHQGDRWQARFDRARQALLHTARRQIETRAWALDRLAARLQHPGAQLAARRGELQRLAGRLQRATARQQGWHRERLLALGRRLDAAALAERQQRRQRLAALGQALQLLDPGQVLQRGYSLTYRADGRLLRAPGEVESGERIDVVLAQGRIAARVLAG